MYSLWEGNRMLTPEQIKTITDLHQEKRNASRLIKDKQKRVKAIYKELEILEALCDHDWDHLSDDKGNWIGSFCNICEKSEFPQREN